MRAVIKINMDNAVFKNNPAGEIQRILYELAEEVSAYGLLPPTWSRAILDINGNRVGDMRIIGKAVGEMKITGRRS